MLERGSVQPIRLLMEGSIAWKNLKGAHDRMRSSPEPSSLVVQSDRLVLMVIFVPRMFVCACFSTQMDEFYVTQQDTEAGMVLFDECLRSRQHFVMQRPESKRNRGRERQRERETKRERMREEKYFTIHGWGSMDAVTCMPHGCR